MKCTLTILLFLLSGTLFSQIPDYRLSDWKNAGLRQKTQITSSVHIRDFGGDTTNGFCNDTAVSKAIRFLDSLGGGYLLFDEGTWCFSNTIVIKDKIVLKGKSTSTILSFDLSHRNLPLIKASGSISAYKYPLSQISEKTTVLNENLKDSNARFVKLSYNDSSMMYSSWAYGSAGQVLEIDSISDKIVHFKGELREIPSADKAPYLQILYPITQAGVECLKVLRNDSSTGQSTNIEFDICSGCYVKGIESENTNFAHVSFDRSINCSVSQSYFHHAFAYGGGGQGYGVVLQFCSGDNLIENNVFSHLRHSILLQSGANGNVVAYNHSNDPYRTDSPLSNSSGDLVCHGNYAHRNLFEGNICQTISIDNSHGRNGPYNTFFRNRVELYGIIISNMQDSQNIICNEITNTGALMGQFLSPGLSHLKLSNNVKGSIQNPASILAKSLYLNDIPGYWDIPIHLFGIGAPYQYKHSKIPALTRWEDSGSISICHTPIRTSKLSNTSKHTKAKAYPNPVQSGDIIYVDKIYNNIDVINGLGIVLKSAKETDQVTTEGIPSGCYILRLDNLYIIVVLEDR